VDAAKIGSMIIDYTTAGYSTEVFPYIDSDVDSDVAAAVKLNPT
jgi:hypothetical protein